ncbi:MAG: DUF3611 family protein [Candidatus Binatia bacterium]
MAGVGVEKIARDFYWFGWVGVGVQAILAFIPLLMFAWALFGTALGSRPTLAPTDHLALVGLAILVFTTFWSYRYTRLAARMADPARRPPRRAVVRTLWVGLCASGLGMAVSLLLLIVEVARLMILVLMTPQAGVPVIQTQTDSHAAWVSAIDVVSLLADVSTLAGELVILGLTLWLLFRVSQAAADYDQAPSIAPG